MTSRSTVVLPVMHIDANPGNIACNICVNAAQMEPICKLQWSHGPKVELFKMYQRLPAGLSSQHRLTYSCSGHCTDFKGVRHGEFRHSGMYEKFVQLFFPSISRLSRHHHTVFQLMYPLPSAYALWYEICRTTPPIKPETVQTFSATNRCWTFCFRFYHYTQCGASIMSREAQQGSACFQLRTCRNSAPKLKSRLIKLPCS